MIKILFKIFKLTNIVFFSIANTYFFYKNSARLLYFLFLLKNLSICTEQKNSFNWELKLALNKIYMINEKHLNQHV